jgi:hypothetical protein
LPAEALADYLPTDAAGVFHLGIRQLREAPAAQPLLPSLRQLALRGQIELGWLGCARVDLAGADDLRAVLVAKGTAGTAWFVRGPIDPERFQLGPKCLQERQVQGRRLWEYKEPDGTLWQLWASPHLLIAASPPRMAELLAFRAVPVPSSERSTPVAPLLAGVDRTRPLWLAVSLQALGRLGRPENRTIDLIVGPILRYARTVTGGLSVGEEIRGDFVFTTANPEAARSLEEGLRSVLLLAEGAGLFVDRDLQPLLRLLGGGEISRDGTTVTLRISSAGTD